jgi:two-component system phosphate regulon response regulator PhoB
MRNVEHSTPDELVATGRVLVIDDHEPLRRLLCLALELGEFEVLGAETLASAESWLRRVHVDAVVLDLQRATTCLQVLRRLRANPDLEQVPLLFLAGEDDDDLRWKALSSGADWFMLRPRSMTELQDRVDECVQHGRARLRAVPAQRRRAPRERRRAG